MAVMSGPPNCSELKLQTNLYTLDPGPLLQIIAAAIVLPASSFAFQAEQWHVTEHHILWYPNMSGCTFQVGSHSSLNFEDDHLVFYHSHWIAVLLQSWMWAAMPPIFAAPWAQPQLLTKLDCELYFCPLKNVNKVTDISQNDENDFHLAPGSPNIEGNIKLGALFKTCSYFPILVYRQWPEVSDLCHTFFCCTSQKAHGHARISRETRVILIELWPCWSRKLEAKEATRGKVTSWLDWFRYITRWSWMVQGMDVQPSRVCLA